MAIEPARLEMLSALARKVLWLSSWTIHHANHIRPNADGLKVGGHQASSASLATAYGLAVTQAAGLALPGDVQEKMITGLRKFVSGAILRGSALRTADLSIRKLAAVAALWRKRCFPHWCRTTSRRTAGCANAPRVA